MPHWLFPDNFEVWQSCQVLILTITKLVWWWAPVTPVLKQSSNPVRIQGFHLKKQNKKQKLRAWQKQKTRRSGLRHKHTGNIITSTAEEEVKCDSTLRMYSGWMRSLRELDHGERTLPWEKDDRYGLDINWWPQQARVHIRAQRFSSYQSTGDNWSHRQKRPHENKSIAELERRLSAFTTLPEDLILNTHIGGLTTSITPAPRRSNTSGLHGHLHLRAHMPTPTHQYTFKNVF